jgi:hypothetical protein
LPPVKRRVARTVAVSHVVFCLTERGCALRQRVRWFPACSPVYSLGSSSLRGRVL